MGIAIIALLAVLLMKAIAGKLYSDCKVGIWLAVITIVVMTGMVMTVIFDKVSLIPVLLLL